jgi:hypothetical protein
VFAIAIQFLSIGKIVFVFYCQCNFHAPFQLFRLGFLTKLTVGTSYIFFTYC